jgi:uncharacterized protein (PEP-CTERM system associated)
MTRNALTALSAVALALLPGLGWTQDEADPSGETQDRMFSFDVETGVEYDSNVALLEVDTSTGVGDAIALLNFGLGFDAPIDGALDLKAGYNFSETAHEDFTDFDLRIHRGSSTLSYDFGRIDAGTILQYARAELDGARFMTLQQTSPYLSTLIGRRVFLRFAYTHSDKDFASNPLRAAKADSWSSDLYYFVDGLRTYLLIGYRHDAEDAVDAQFDYAGDRFRAQISHRFALGSRELTVKAGLRSEQRDYENETPSIGAPRRDDRVQLEASGDLPLSERVTASLRYRRSNNDSNLPAVDFDEDVLSLSVTAEF